MVNFDLSKAEAIVEGFKHLTTIILQPEISLNRAKGQVLGLHPSLVLVKSNLVKSVEIKMNELKNELLALLKTSNGIIQVVIDSAVNAFKVLVEFTKSLGVSLVELLKNLKVYKTFYKLIVWTIN